MGRGFSLRGLGCSGLAVPSRAISILIRVIRAYWFFFQEAIRLLYYFRYEKKRLSTKEEPERTARVWEKTGERSSRFFSRLGGIYIKLGQFLANAAHLFPDEFLKPLQGLQDSVPPRSIETMRKRFIQEWNRHPEEVFETFDPSPLASASTAQVHRATYRGREVAVKVLYPGIEKSVQRDMGAVFHVLKWMHRLVLPFPFEEIHKQMSDLFQEEMDLGQERENILKMSYLFREDSEVVIPRVESEISTKAILVTEFIRGKKWIFAPKVSSAKDGKSPYVKILIRIFLIMIFRFRFFHADPHPGNIFITDSGKICLLDFGAIGRIEEEEEESLVMILQSAMEGNSQGILDGLERMGVLGESMDREEILGLIDYSVGRIRNIVGDIDQFRNIRLDPEGIRKDLEFIKNMKTGLRDLVRALHLPAHYISLQRTADLLIGNIAWVDPYRSVFDYAEEPFRTIILRERLLPWWGKW